MGNFESVLYRVLMNTVKFGLHLNIPNKLSGDIFEIQYIIGWHDMIYFYMLINFYF